MSMRPQRLGEHDALVQMFSVFADGSHDAVLLLDQANAILARNDRAREALAISTPQGECSSLDDVLAHPAPVDFPTECEGLQVEARDAGGRAFPAELSIRRLSAATSLRMAFLKDVSALRAPRTAPSSGDEVFRALFDANLDAMFVHDHTGQIVLVNQTMCRMFGCTPEQARTLTAVELSSNTPPYTEAHAIALVERALREGFCRFDWQSRRLNGEVFWTEVALGPVQLFGKPHVVACVREIQHRKSVEEALRASEERFTRIFHGLSTMLAFTDPVHERILDVNDAWLKTTGLTREAVIGRTGTELGIWLDGVERDRLLKQLREAGRVLDHEVELRLGDRVMPTLLSAELMSLRDSNYILWEMRDQSERRRVETEREKLRAQLVQSQKMESIGQLAGGIAHDFNNLLTVINGCASLVLRDLPPSDKNWSLLQDVQNAGERAASLTQQLLAFSRKQVMRARAVDLNALVGDTERLMRRLIGEDITFQVSLDPQLPRIYADPSQMNQVLFNLVVNARDAMPEGGLLYLETSIVVLDAQQSGPDMSAHSGTHVRLTVGDDGMGMTPKVQERIFEPFFTTKPRGKGSGLGLSTIYGIVEQSGGFIAVHSEPNKGSRFDVYFPALDASIGDSSVLCTHHEPSDAPTSETVLLVEDQPEVRRLVTRLLQELGYEVLAASSGDDALKLMANQGDRVRLLLTDVVMPGMSGRVLSEKLRQLWPNLKVVFMSGYTDDVVVHHGATESDATFLQKPFGGTELHKVLRNALGASALSPG
jgi:PAS domain S-box-containing protein